MKFKKGDMWESFPESDLFLVTGNSVVKKDGTLVMGRGIAKEAKERYPQFPLAAGQYLSRHQEYRKNKPYGLLLNVYKMCPKLGVFQVKAHYKDKASIELIRYSTMLLSIYIKKYESMINTVNLNFPGIGYGGLDRKEVLPILEEFLSDSAQKVTIWEK